MCDAVLQGSLSPLLQGYLLQLEGHLRLQLRIELEQAEVRRVRGP